MNALNYARERIQGRHLQATGKDAPGVPIIQHPDVRRMLLTMKVYTEGIRSILYYTGYCEDMMHISADPREKARYQGLIDVLIPIAKGYVSDRAFDVCNLGVQVYGGYGYTKEYPQEQLLRDCKITHIYEGTNGIQAMDLLGRKLGLNKGGSFKDLLEEMTHCADGAKAIDGLQGPAASLAHAIDRLKEVALHLEATMRSGKMMNAFAAAYPFMDVTGDAILAWMLLWRASAAARQLAGGAKKSDVAFYEGQIKGARFFTSAMLPLTLGKMSAILADEGIIDDISDENFGGK
jgi:hypothetical protein